MVGLTNDLKVVGDERGPLPINVIAAQIYALDCHAIVPHDIKAAGQLLAELEARGNRPLSGADRRYAEASELYNGALRDLARAKRARLYSPDYLLPQPGNTPDALQELRGAVGELHQRLEAFEERRFDPHQETTPERRRIVDLEQHVRAIEAKLRQAIEHSNKLVNAINNLEEKLAALSPHPDLIERRRDGP
jgi:hypothetical protein